jgi:MFS superfamily sulfate permease-like transporter
MLAMGLFRLGALIRYIPISIVLGFMALAPTLQTIAAIIVGIGGMILVKLM